MSWDQDIKNMGTGCCVQATGRSQCSGCCLQLRPMNSQRVRPCHSLPVCSALCNESWKDLLPFGFGRGEPLAHQAPVQGRIRAMQSRVDIPSRQLCFQVCRCAEHLCLKSVAVQTAGMCRTGIILRRRWAVLLPLSLAGTVHLRASKSDELAGLCASNLPVLCGCAGRWDVPCKCFLQESLGSTVANEVGWRNCSYATPSNRLAGLGAPHLISCCVAAQSAGMCHTSSIRLSR